MSSIIKTFLAFLLVCTVLQAEAKKLDVSLVISGGVSLGAYESGYNWAILRILSKIKNGQIEIDPKLRSVAGASAGSINALLSAMYWCQKESIPYQNTIDNNLFYKTWVNLGIEDLVVKNTDTSNTSTLFSRRELKKKANMIMEHMGKPIFREGCEVPMGFAVTKVTPIIEEFEGIKIKNQQFSVPLTFKVRNGYGIIANKKMPPSTNFYLSIPGIEKDRKKIIDVLFASSAFPGAFQQVKLRYRYKGKIQSHYFIDGGVYANTPLQLAIELSPDAKTFFFMDPSNVRKEKVNNDKKKEEAGGFLSTMAAPLLSAADIFQQMKLYETINHNFRNNPSYHLVLSSRYFPLTAGFLEHFGAFMDKNFRIYDYYVGIYDAIYHTASAMIKREYTRNHSQIEVMDKFANYLGIDQNPEALTAYTFFRDTEFGSKKADRNNRFAAIYYAFDMSLSESKRYDTDGFKYFLSKLDMRYLKADEGPFLAYARKNVNHWYKRPLRYIVDRTSTLENYRALQYPEHRTIAKLISMSAWAGSSFIKEKDGWDILPMNAPDDPDLRGVRTALRFLPSEFSIDTVNGGLSFAYEAYWYKDIDFISGLEFKPSYNFQSQDNGGDFIRMDINLFKEYGDFIKVGMGASGFGNMEGSFYHRDTAYGGNVYFDFMDIFRATYVRRHGDIGNNNYFYLGIENLPSLFYWLYR